MKQSSLDLLLENLVCARDYDPFSFSVSTLPSTHWWGLEGILSALGNKGKLGMTDPCPYRDHRLIGETNGLFPGVR